MRARVAPILRDRLGEDGTQALVTLVDEAGHQWKGEVMDAVTERFGRMLAEECGKVRVEMAEGLGSLRTEMAQQSASLRTDMAEAFGKVRTGMAEQAVRLRTEMAEQSARLEVRLAGQRAELLKWSFLVWLGQVAAMAALLAFMLRGLPR